MVNTEWDILQQAMDAFNRNTGRRIQLDRKADLLDARRLAMLLHVEGYKKPLVIEIKKWVQQANLGALINQMKTLPADGILVADYVNPNMAEKLREQRVQFIDTAGNAYLNLPPTYIFIKGNRPQLAGLAGKKDKTGLAFAATGLKVVYAFLCDPELVRAPYRKIADTADVALGTVGWVLHDLKAAGFMIERGRTGERRLDRCRDLFDRWVELYPVKLRPKLLMGRFVAGDPYWWEDIDIRQFQAYWGGETAGAKYTGFLDPKVATVYLPETAGNKLLLEQKLRAATDRTGDDPGLVTIYRPFWTEKLNLKNPGEEEGMVHPILCYADLVATGDPRNLETAELLFEKHLAEHIRQDR